MLGTKKSTFEKLEADNQSDFASAVESAESAIEAQGLQCVDGEPDIVIILRHNGKLSGNDKLVHAAVLIGATPEQIIDAVQKPTYDA